MEHIIFTLCLAAILRASVLVASKLAWLFTEKWGPLFAFKPFNCEACAAFWLTLALAFTCFWAANFQAWPLDVLLAGIVALGNYYRTLSKFNIDE